ncbi:MAG: signal peptidase II, partial [Alphaproteobacteria bacterium]|nr:signal peptidase II [Alphaproteobacteria bacterium]
MLKPRLLSLVFFLIVFAADQGTKFWAIDAFAPIGGMAVTGFFNLVFVLNHGITFGMFQQSDPNGVWLLIGFSLAIVAYLLWMWWHSESDVEVMVLMAVIGGATGNVLDRVRIGAVVDFLDFHIAGYHWPAFNIADSAIV